MTRVDAMPKIDILLHGYSLDTDQGTGGFCTVTLIEGLDARGERKRILIDPAHVGRRPVLWNALAQRGLGPKDIDAVVLTHAHWDHIQNIDVFDHARVLLHPDERAYSLVPHRNDWATPAWTGAILERHAIVEVIGGDELLQGVHIVDMPGHTAGSIGVGVDNSAGLSIITGDAVHHARVALSRENPLVFWDADLARESINRVVKMADVIYPGHDRIFRVAKGNKIEYLEPFQLTIKNIAQDADYISWDTSTPTQEIMPGIEEQMTLKKAFAKAAEERRSRVLGPPDGSSLDWWQVDPEQRP